MSERPIKGKSLSNARKGPRAIRVEVGCRSSHHSKRSARIQFFEWSPGYASDDLAWITGVLPGGWVAIEVAQAPRVTSDGSWAEALPRTEQVVDPSTGELAPGQASPQSRRRFRFECKLCGEVRVVRGERVAQILERARLAGVSWLPIDHF